MSQADSKLDAGRGKFEWRSFASVQAMLLMLALSAGAVAFYLFLSKQDLQVKLAAAEKSRDEQKREKEVLREKLIDNLHRLDGQIVRTIAAHDAEAKVRLQLAVASERADNLSATLASACRRLQLFGIDPHSTDVDELAKSEEGKIRGLVLSVSNQQAELSIGSDDGVHIGLEFDVYRGERYLGLIQVMRTQSDSSVATVLFEFLQYPIRRGDHVVSRLKT